MKIIKIMQRTKILVPICSMCFKVKEKPNATEQERAKCQRVAKILPLLLQTLRTSGWIKGKSPSEICGEVSGKLETIAPDVELSHGLCEDCVKKHYSDIATDIWRKIANKICTIGQVDKIACAIRLRKIFGT